MRVAAAAAATLCTTTAYRRHALSALGVYSGDTCVFVFFLLKSLVEFRVVKNRLFEAQDTRVKWTRINGLRPNHVKKGKNEYR